MESVKLLTFFKYFNEESSIPSKDKQIISIIKYFRDHDYVLLHRFYKLDEA